MTSEFYAHPVLYLTMIMNFLDHRSHCLSLRSFSHCRKASCVVFFLVMSLQSMRAVAAEGTDATHNAEQCVGLSFLSEGN